MNKHPLGKNLLLSFLPILIFVVADEYLSNHFAEEQATRYAIILAVGMGALQAIYIFIKEQRLDKMLLMDTGLIVLLGGISLVSGSDIFFKLKPALVQAVLVIILGVMAFLKPQLLAAMTGRFREGVELEDFQLQAMQRSAQGLTLLFFLHTLLIVYSALFLSKAAWAFISGPLVYVLAGLYFLGMLLLGKIRQKRQPKK